MKKKIIISESDWKSSIYRTREWERTVNITNWIHDYETKEYIIEYKELE
jgi:hypothetical protein